MMQNRFVFVKGKDGEVRAGWGLEDETHLYPSAVSSLWHWLHNCMNVVKMCCTQRTHANALHHNTDKMKYRNEIVAVNFLPMLLDF